KTARPRHRARPPRPGRRGRDFSLARDRRDAPQHSPSHARDRSPLRPAAARPTLPGHSPPDEPGAGPRMPTDPWPRRLGPRGGYEASARLETVPAPPAQLASLFPLLEAAQDGEDHDLLEDACRRMVRLLSFAYCVPAPELKLLGPRPHDTSEGRL